MLETRRSRALAAAGVSTLIAALIAVWYVRIRLDADTVLLVDTTAELRALLEERAAFAPSAPSGEPSGIDELGRALPRKVADEVDEDVVALFYRAVTRAGFEYHPTLLFRRSPHVSPWQRFPEHPDGGWTVRTNDLGLREDEDVAVQRPDLRLVVIGDSHTAGACANGESFTNLLEARLAESRSGAAESVEALNAGRGAYDPFNYLGAVAAYGDLEPHVLVLVMYGGNDFQGALGLRRYLFRGGPRRTRPFDRERVLASAGERANAWLGQELDQVLHFLNNPEEEDVALAVTCAITTELARQCAEREIVLLAVYLPPPTLAQPERFQAEARAALESVDAPADALAVAERLRHGWTAFLERRSIPCLDLTPLFRPVDEPLYWSTDLHLNLAGHALVAEALERALDPLLAE